jgi:hypothetical protein
MLRRKAVRSILAVGLFTLFIAGAFGVQRVYFPRRHWVFYPGAHFATFQTVRPVLVGNWGEVDFNVYPEQSKVFVDGILLGKADDVNGWPSTAHLKAGPHTVRLVSPRGQTYQTKIYVQPGKELNFDYRF